MKLQSGKPLLNAYVKEKAIVLLTYFAFLLCAFLTIFELTGTSVAT